MGNTLKAPRISLLAFYLLWAERMGWEVPALHIRVCVWLENKGALALLMLPRGHAKSTLLGIYNAWRYYCTGSLRILHQGESDNTANKTARDTKAILQRHPLTWRHCQEIRGEISFWWLPTNEDERNPSMQAAGILSNITSSRADEIQNDDIEVPRNILTQESREKLRNRLGEQVHILVPGGTELYVGTPHTYESIYTEIKELGADCFIVRMFEKECRLENTRAGRYPLTFVPEFVFSGIGKPARLLKLNVDYKIVVKGGEIDLVLNDSQGLVDCYADQAWPERFDADEVLKRRRKTRTLGEWDSQYQLHAKPVTQTRLDPERITAYQTEPVIKSANNASTMWLGKQQIVGACAQWDPSSGNLKNDASSLSVCFQDAAGRRYIQSVLALTGEIAEFGADHKTIVGGQVWKICDIVELYALPGVQIETNGIGQFAPAVLRAALKQRGLECAVVPVNNTANKNKRILEVFEPLLLARGMLWAHVDVLNGPLGKQMREWNPLVKDQADDFLDATAGAISGTPERLKGVPGAGRKQGRPEWRPITGSVEAAFER